MRSPVVRLALVTLMVFVSVVPPMARIWPVPSGWRVILPSELVAGAGGGLFPAPS